ncbi:MAG: hypothetical protein WA324_06715, partial [Bryobacteraceae bacterium]
GEYTRRTDSSIARHRSPDARPHSASLIERALVQVDTTTIVEWSGRRFDGIYIASENAELGGHYEWAPQ